MFFTPDLTRYMEMEIEKQSFSRSQRGDQKAPRFFILVFSFSAFPSFYSFLGEECPACGRQESFLSLTQAWCCPHSSLHPKCCRSHAEGQKGAEPFPSSLGRKLCCHLALCGPCVRPLCKTGRRMFAEGNGICKGKKTQEDKEGDCVCISPRMSSALNKSFKNYFLSPAQCFHLLCYFAAPQQPASHPSHINLHLLYCLP